MNITLKNDRYTVTVSSRGAEIQELTERETGRLIVWYGDSSVWGWNAPICFPFCGKLKDNWSTIGGKRYDFTSNHGFIRDQTHTLIYADETCMEWESHSSPATKERYPFDYIFKTYYKLSDTELTYRCTITCTDTKPMYYSFGTHTAFCAHQPSTDDSVFNYQIEFEKDEKFVQYYDSGKEGYKTRLLTAVEYPPLETVHSKNVIPLSDKGFGNGLLLTELRSSWAGLRNITNNTLTRISIKDFPVVVLWQNTNGRFQFVCIEPWAGTGDIAETDHVFEHKTEICTLQPGKSITYDQSISFNLPLA